MIIAVHTLAYAEDAEAARTFFRDVLEWPFVDAHDGWLIFKTGPSELGVHPAGDGPPRNEISLMCDDLDQTITNLKAKGAVFEGDAEQRAFGRGIALSVPGAGTMFLYEPRHATAYDL